MAGTLRAQERQRRLRNPQDAEEVGLELRPGLLRGDLVDHPEQAEARVVHHHVEAPEVGMALAHGLLRRRAVADGADIPMLAREAGTSPPGRPKGEPLRPEAEGTPVSLSTFHGRFKAVTGVSPLQHQKIIRLHKARGFMVNAGWTAQRAAFEVGYESTSQFSREFRRMFGDSLGGVAAQLRARLNDMQQPHLWTTLSFAHPPA